MKKKITIAVSVLITLLFLVSLSFEIFASDVEKESSSVPEIDYYTSINIPSESSEDSADESSENSTEHEEPIYVLEPVTKNYVLLESDSLNAIREELDYCQTQLQLTTTMIDAALSLGYDFSATLLSVAYQDYENYIEFIEYYEARIEELTDIKHVEGLDQYPAATYIWYFMKEQGWSDYVCAGIMGNIMQETGGRSLNIDYMHSNAYYGMCCWKKAYHPEVVGADLEGQCKYLLKTVITSMDTYGYLYKEGYTFKDFLEAESIEEAAAAFMIVYERPGHTNPIKRVQNGEKAYAYFVSSSTDNDLRIIR